MGHDSLEDLRRLVVDDPELRTRLLRAVDRQAFIGSVIEVAESHGIDVSAHDVVEALAAARRQRQERWV
jgi:hypothetical protein